MSELLQLQNEDCPIDQSGTNLAQIYTRSPSILRHVDRIKLINYIRRGHRFKSRGVMVMVSESLGASNVFDTGENCPSYGYVLFKKKL